jgi:hypothetical protein
MDIRLRVVIFFASFIAVVVVATLVVHSLIWLLERRLDPSLPLRAKVAARIEAIEATLHAVKLGLIRIPRVYRRTLE